MGHWGHGERGVDWMAKWKSENAKIMSIEEFLEGDSLHLCASNNTNVDAEG